jgi:hypothetical protein
MVDNVIRVHRELKFAAEKSVDLDDALAMGVRHAVVINVEIPEILDADASGICAFNASGNVLERPADCDYAVRKCGNMLGDVGPAILVDVKVTHRLEKGDVIGTSEARVIRRPSVMVLDSYNRSIQPQAVKPLCEFESVKKCEPHPGCMDSGFLSAVKGFLRVCGRVPYVP